MKLKVSGSVAFIGACVVVCVIIAAVTYLESRMALSPTFWTSLAALLAALGNLVRVETVDRKTDAIQSTVDSVQENTNGSASRLQRAALTALAELPPDRARSVLNALDRPPDPTTPVAGPGEPPFAGYGEPPPRTGG